MPNRQYVPFSHCPPYSLSYFIFIYFQFAQQTTCPSFTLPSLRTVHPIDISPNGIAYSYCMAIFFQSAIFPPRTFCNCPFQQLTQLSPLQPQSPLAARCLQVWTGAKAAGTERPLEAATERPGVGCVSLQGTATSSIFVATNVLLRPTDVCREKHVFCRHKHVFVVTNVLSGHAYFCRDKRRILLRQILFVATNVSRDKVLVRKKHFVATKLWSRQAYFCRDKRRLCREKNVRRDKNDTCGSSRQWCLWTATVRELWCCCQPALPSWVVAATRE